MTDWSFPSLSQTWANFVAAIKGRDESNAKMDYSADSNLPDGTVRWSSTNSRFEIWDATGLAWSALSSKYLINVDTVDSEHADDFASAVGGTGARQAKDADTVDGVNLPGTIAQVLSNHDKAAHDALNIDADTLDSLNATQFLRSDAASTMSGSLTLAGQVLVSNVAPTIKLNESDAVADNRLWYVQAADEFFKIRALNDAETLGTDVITISRTGTSADFVNVANGTLLANGSLVWHAGNVGTAPGLNSSKSSTGYVDLPGGLIMQWGLTSVTGDGTTNASFAKTFPNACLQAVACATTSIPTANDDVGAGVVTFNTTIITLFNNDAIARNVRWFAIGH